MCIRDSSPRLFLGGQQKCPKSYSFNERLACPANFGRNPVAQLSTVAHSLLYHAPTRIVNQIFQIFTNILLY
jgi:hypothetical protein